MILKYPLSAVSGFLQAGSFYVILTLCDFLKYCVSGEILGIILSMLVNFIDYIQVGNDFKTIFIKVDFI